MDGRARGVADVELARRGPERCRLDGLMGYYLFYLFDLYVFAPAVPPYAALTASILRLKARPNAVGIAAVCAALIPFGLWAASLSSVINAKAQEKAAIAAIPKTPLPAKVGAAVIDAGHIRKPIDTIVL
jgi:hypothetical protein